VCPSLGITLEQRATPKVVKKLKLIGTPTKVDSRGSSMYVEGVVVCMCSTVMYSLSRYLILLASYGAMSEAEDHLLPHLLHLSHLPHMQCYVDLQE